MKKTMKMLATALLLSAICLSACEKPSIAEETNTEEQEAKDLFHLSFRVAQFEHIPFNQAVDMSRATDVKQVCTRISLALFKDGVKVKSIHQDTKDAHFGKIDVTLPAGTYQVIAIAHSGSGSATITSPEEISFPKNKMTDTFYYCQEVTVGGNASYQLEMKRAVAMFRLVTTDAIPTAVKTMKFYYTGGSSTFNAVTGVGAKNSRQTEERTVTDAQHAGPGQFDVYTFPHTPSDVLKITVSALNASGDVITEHTFEEVPVKVNEITQYKGSFFQGTTPTDANIFSFSVQDEWTKKEYPY